MRFMIRELSAAALRYSTYLLVTAALAGSAAAQVVELDRRLADWVEFAPSWRGSAFEQYFTPTPTPLLGCLSGGGAVSMPVDGGWVTLETSNGNCPVLDGTSAQDVADGAIEEGTTLRMTFDPPIRAFYSFYSSLAVGSHVDMRVIDDNGLVDHVETSTPSNHAVESVGHGFVSRVPITTIEWTSTETGTTLLGRFGGSISPSAGTFEEHRNEPCGPWLCDFGYAYSVDYEGDMIFEWDRQNYGVAVAVNRDWLAVGAETLPHGEVRLYGRSHGGTDNWGLVKTLTPPVPSGGIHDLFGVSLALEGDTLVVGAPNFWGNEHTPGEGVAFVFSKDAGGPENWGSVQTIVPPGSTTFFGGSVAIQNDTLVIGAPHTNPLPGFPWTDRSGSAYIYQRPSGSQGEWSYSTQLSPPLVVPDARFGTSVAIDGTGIVVGAPGEPRGHYSTSCATDLDNLPGGGAYVFRRGHGGVDNWGCSTRLYSTCTSVNCNFGAAVAISGPMVVVGAPRERDARGVVTGNITPFVSNVFVDSFPTEYNGWTPPPGAKFGASLGLQGNALYVGAPPAVGTGIPGAVHQFSLVVDPIHGLHTWTYSRSIQPARSTIHNEFGRSAAMGDGTLAVASRQFVYLLGPLFADGFEAGDTSAWGSVP